ncbi:MAG: hypothetical protein V2G41_09880 [bacterium JZ-2024 1]
MSLYPEPVDSYSWVVDLPEDSYVDVFVGANFLKRIDSSLLKASSEPVEEILLDSLGAGYYRLVPVVEGRRRWKESLRVKVGKTESVFGAPPQGNVAPEVDALKEMVADLKRQVEEKSRPSFPVQEVVSAAAGLLSTLLSAVKGTDTQSRIVERMLEVTLQKQADPITEALVKKALSDKGADTFDQLARYEQMRANIKAELEESLRGGMSGHLVNALAPLIERLLGTGQSSAKPAEVPALEYKLDYKEEAPALSGIVQRWSARLNDMCRQKPASEVAEFILQSYNAAKAFGLQDPTIDRFSSDPEAFLEEVLPQGSEEVRKIVLERIKREGL